MKKKGVQLKVNIFLLLVIVCIPFYAITQNTFNKTFSFQNHREEFAMIIQNDSCYYFVGGSREENSNNDSTKLVIVKTDLDGVIIDSLNHQFDSLSNRGNYNSNSILLSDTGFYLSGVSVNGYENTVNGNLIYFKNFETSPDLKQYPLDSTEIFPTLMRVNSDFLIFGMTNTYGNGSYDFYLLKTDSLGTVKFDTTFGGFSYEQIGNGIKINDNHFVIGGRTYSDAYQRVGFVGNAANAQFIAVDSNFNQLWNTVLYTDGVDLVPMLKGYGYFYYTIEFPVDPSNIGTFNTHLIGQIDVNNGDVLWLDTVKIEEEIVATRFMETVDDTSFIVFTEVESPGIPYSYAKIIKYNDQGQIVWQRSYYEGNHNGCHLNTMIVDSDGFLVFGGTVANLETQSQDAWLLKLRPDGCLSDTDCGLVTGIIDLTPGKGIFGVRVFPNPVKDIAHIIVEFTANHKNEELELQVYDIEGKLVYSEGQLLQGQIPQFSVDVSSYPSGTYFVQACIEGAACGSSKLLVE